MTHSFAQKAELTCPKCQKTFTSNVWLIIDGDERPDLLKKARQGTLHRVPCPHCGVTNQLDGPLVILRRSATPPLLYSPAQTTTLEQNKYNFGGLVGELRASLGDEWRDEWVGEGLRGLAREMVPVALGDDPEAALAEQNAAMEAALERLQKIDPTQYQALLQAASDLATLQSMGETITALVEAESWDDAQNILNEHPELLSDEADALLTRFIVITQAQGDNDAREAFADNQTLLRRCREIGVEAAFDEMVDD